MFERAESFRNTLIFKNEFGLLNQVVLGQRPFTLYAHSNLYGGRIVWANNIFRISTVEAEVVDNVLCHIKSVVDASRTPNVLQDIGQVGWPGVLLAVGGVYCRWLGYDRGPKGCPMVALDGVRRNGAALAVVAGLISSVGGLVPERSSPGE